MAIKTRQIYLLVCKAVVHSSSVLTPSSDLTCELFVLKRLLQMLLTLLMPQATLAVGKVKMPLLKSKIAAFVVLVEIAGGICNSLPWTNNITVYRSMKDFEDHIGYNVLVGWCLTTVPVTKTIRLSEWVTPGDTAIPGMTSLKDGDLQHSGALAQSPEGDIEPQPSVRN